MGYVFLYPHIVQISFHSKKGRSRGIPLTGKGRDKGIPLAGFE